MNYTYNPKGKRTKRVAGLAHREAETLALVYGFQGKLGTPSANTCGGPGWLRP